MGGYLLGADFGGSAVKITLLRSDGAVAATATREYPTYYPQNGWVEQAPEELFSAFFEQMHGRPLTQEETAALNEMREEVQP